ncbi:MAG: exodeoxyribonuclease VII small subunit [Deltaproteobacteria bacterium]|nr:MAG: exodeoxyribonuclease VII small subunit [Deltaproteobacteria bacterium]
MEERELTFEEALKRLEEIVRKLEEGRDTLENSMKLFEEGVKLARFCNEKLDEAEKKLQVLMKRGEEIRKEDIDEEEFFSQE